MIHLIANNGAIDGAATACLTLYEKCKLENPFFTFKIVHKTSQYTTIFNGLDISTSPEYFNKFEFVVTESNPIPTMGKFVAEPGEYNYFVYESGEAGILEIDSCERIVETGILKIVVQPETQDSYEYLNDTTSVYYKINN